MALFHNERIKSLPKQRKSLKDLTRIVASSHLFAEEKRQTLLKNIQEFLSFEVPRYVSLCFGLTENLVRYCQSLPETANSYYSQAGGFLDHALHRTDAALSLFQEFMIQEQKDSLSEQQKLWQYALYSAAILQGIGKLFVDFRIHLFDPRGQILKAWNPLLESLGSIGQYYSYEFKKEPEIELRRRINLLLAKALMPASGFAWIASDEEVLAIWLALINEDERSAGTLGAILIRADAIAIQRYFTEFMQKHAGPYSGGRYGVGTFSGGSTEHLIDKEQVVGLEFIQWITKSLEEGRIQMNKTPLLMVPGGMVMSQEMYQLFVREHPEYKNWQAVQKGFLSLNLHTQEGGSTIFSKYAIALPQKVQVHHMKTNTTESLSAMELINKVQFQGRSALHKVNAAGTWQAVENGTNALSPGAKKGA